MDPNTGAIVDVRSEEDALARGLIPVRRKLTDKELFTTQIELYSPCVCGSGQKAKFCCRKPPEYVYRPDATIEDIRNIYQPPKEKPVEETANVG
jgi:hypothetical protein